MRSFLSRRWFLLVLAAGCLVAWFAPAALHWTVHLDPRFVVAPALFLAALSLESRTLFQSILRPWPAVWATLMSYGLVPLLAWSATSLFANTDLRIGLMIIASVPCTLVSAVFWTRLARGNEATAMLVILLT